MSKPRSKSSKNSKRRPNPTNNNEPPTPKHLPSQHPLQRTDVSSIQRHGSALAIPGSRARRNRQSGAMKDRLNTAFSDDWKSAKRVRMRDMQMDAPFSTLNSFISSWTKDRLVGELFLTLKSMPDMDVEIHEIDYMIRGRKYINYVSCEFQIELFGTTKRHSQYPNHILVEFQRRGGDGFVFQQFISSVMASMNQEAIEHTKFQKYDTNHTNHNHLIGWRSRSFGENDSTEEESKSHTHTRFLQRSSSDSNLHSIDKGTLQRLLHCLFHGDGHSKRTACLYLAKHMENNEYLLKQIMHLEPHIVIKLSDLLLKCIDPELVRSIGCTLYFMLEQSNDLRSAAQQSDLKKIFVTVSQRWTRPIETRFGSKKSKSANIVNVLPSLQAAQKMMSCVAVLE